MAGGQVLVYCIQLSYSDMQHVYFVEMLLDRLVIEGDLAHIPPG